MENNISGISGQNQVIPNDQPDRLPTVSQETNIPIAENRNTPPIASVLSEIEREVPNFEVIVAANPVSGQSYEVRFPEGQTAHSFVRNAVMVLAKPETTNAMLQGRYDRQINDASTAIDLLIDGVGNSAMSEFQNNPTLRSLVEDRNSAQANLQNANSQAGLVMDQLLSISDGGGEIENHPLENVHRDLYEAMESLSDIIDADNSRIDRMLAFARQNLNSEAKNSLANLMQELVERLNRLTESPFSTGTDLAQARQ